LFNLLTAAMALCRGVVVLWLVVAKAAWGFVVPLHPRPHPGPQLRRLAMVPTETVAFADQGGNLAGTLFQASLAPYVGFLYFLNYERNKAPDLVKFGFGFLLLFVAATIPTGILSTKTFGVSLADCDWLHGGAEALLTVSNILLVLGFRQAMTGKEDFGRGLLPPEGAGDDESASSTPLAASPPGLPSPGRFVVANGRAKAFAFASAVAAVALIVGGVPALHLEAHSQFLGGLGGFDVGLGPEPANALSIPTWIVHYSSVAEFVVAMGLAYRYSDAVQNPKWKTFAWAMLPSHVSGLCACTYHLFYNPASLKWLVTTQAALTCLGNLTLCLAAFALARSNGWTVPFLEDEKQIGVSTPGVTATLDDDPLVFPEIAAFAVAAAYLTKYASVPAAGLLATANPIAAAAIIAGIPVITANTVLQGGEIETTASE